MTIAVSLAQSGSQVLMVFSAFVAVALLMSILMTSDRPTTKDFYIGNGHQSPLANGLALLSAVSFLGSPGLVALSGYDGLPYLLGPLAAWVVMLLWFAEPYYNNGRFTIGDSLAGRLRPRPVHLAAGIATLLINMLYLTLQLVGAGALAIPVLGISGTGARQVVITVLGLLVILYVIIGGMRATTLMQLAKAVILLGGGLVLSAMVMSRFHWNIAELLHSAARSSGMRDGFLQPRVRSGKDGTDRFDSVSLQLALLLGAVGLPHVLMRLRTVRDGHQARRSVQWVVILSAVYGLVAILLSLGGTALIGPQKIIADNPSGNTVVRLLAEFLGGSFMVTVVACAAFASILAVAAATTLSAATSLAHDLYGMVIKRGTASQVRELAVARGAVVMVGLIGTLLSVLAQGSHLFFLMGLAFALAASAILPSLAYSMYWKRFTTKGATWSIYGGLLSTMLLVIVSPSASGNPTALLPDMDFAVFPLRNPGLISIPVGFLLGWLGSILDRDEPDGADYATSEVRTLTGAGARND